MASPFNTPRRTTPKPPLPITSLVTSTLSGALLVSVAMLYPTEREAARLDEITANQRRPTVTTSRERPIAAGASFLQARRYPTSAGETSSTLVELSEQLWPRRASLPPSPPPGERLNRARRPLTQRHDVRRGAGRDR